MSRFGMTYLSLLQRQALLVINFPLHWYKIWLVFAATHRLKKSRDGIRKDREDSNQTKNEATPLESYHIPIGALGVSEIPPYRR